MKRTAPRTNKHQQRLTVATSTVNLTPSYQKTVQAGRKYSMPARPANKKSPAAKARAVYHKIPTTTPADDPAAYTKNPHEYGDVLIRPDSKGQTRLGGVLQRDLVYWIERHTWGKNVGSPQKVVRPEWAKLSLSQLAKLCGSDRRTVARSLADLKFRGIIEWRDRTGCGNTTAKMYKLTPEKWKKAPYYESKAMELAADEIEEAEAEETPELMATDGPERTVDPGRVSKPQAVAVSPSKGAPVVAIRLVYRSLDLPWPVSFRATPGRNGRVQISCRATAPQFFANPSPSDVANKENSNYETAINRLMVSEFEKPFAPATDPSDKKFFQSIVEAAGPDLHPDFFDSYCRSEIHAMRRMKKPVQSGILVSMAAQAARKWPIVAAAIAAATPDPSRDLSAPKPTAEEIASIDAWEKECHPCNATGRRGFWYQGVFSEMTGKMAEPCRSCNGTGAKQ